MYVYFRSYIYTNAYPYVFTVNYVPANKLPFAVLFCATKLRKNLVSGTY